MTRFKKKKRKERNKAAEQTSLSPVMQASVESCECPTDPRLVPLFSCNRACDFFLRSYDLCFGWLTLCVYVARICGVRRETIRENNTFCFFFLTDLGRRVSEVEPVLFQEPQCADASFPFPLSLFNRLCAMLFAHDDF